jgi:hypothetical protein
LSALLRPLFGGWQAELTNAHFPGESRPIGAGGQGNLDCFIGNAQIAKLSGDSETALAAIRVVSHKVGGVSLVVQDAAVDELLNRGGDDGGVVALVYELLGQLAAGEVTPGQERDRRRANRFCIGRAGGIDFGLLFLAKAQVASDRPVGQQGDQAELA